VTTLRTSAFRGGVDSFTAALAENHIPYHQIQRLSDRSEAGGMALEVVLTGSGWCMLAKVLVAWVGASKSRRINIITKVGTVIWLDGYSADDVAKALELTTHIAMIDTKPTDESE